MHKSWGNMIEFNEAADKMGVDVMRWLFCSHKPENDLLFGYHVGDEVRRGFLIPLWNVYSFFVTYANIDGWEPQSASLDPAFPEGDTPKSGNLLDIWILARLNQVVERTENAITDSDFYAATIVVNAFLDDLTNWYVRRSRRRFWKSEHDADKNTAYSTLYHVLVKLARLLAPFTPFVSEVIYQNLVHSEFPQAYESAHHTAWPKADLAMVDEDLLEQMSLARRIASLGLSARSSAGMKVRQPLTSVLVYAGKADLRDELVEIVEDELNVKGFEFVEREGSLVSYRILPDNQLLGPKFGARFPKVRQALVEANPDQIAQAVRAGLPVQLEVEGEALELLPNEVLINTEPLPGLAVAADRLITVAVDAALTPELRAEGLARDIVRRVQSMRKEAGFNIEDRITTYYLAEGELAGVFTDWGYYIRAETLTTELVAAEPPTDVYRESLTLEGAQLTLGVRKN
jgi:isoleucyl-tRNA synthetase